jgi:hypothetical protein
MPNLGFTVCCLMPQLQTFVPTSCTIALWIPFLRDTTTARRITTQKAHPGMNTASD